LSYDPVPQKLLIVCKDNAGVPDEKKSTKDLYAFNITTNNLIDKPFLLINKKDFVKIAGDKLNFNPSAIAIHPVTHDIYTLTTLGNIKVWQRFLMIVFLSHTRKLTKI
jgi:hypothetical protein